MTRTVFWLLLNSTCTVPRFSLQLHHHRPVGWGWAKGCEGGQLGQLAPAGQRVHIMSYLAIKLGGSFSKVAFAQSLSISQLIVSNCFSIRCLFPPLFPLFVLIYFYSQVFSFLFSDSLLHSTRGLICHLESTLYT